jgi:hypothetical protein
MYRLFTLVSAPPGWLALLLGNRQHRHCQRITLVSPEHIQLVYDETNGSMNVSRLHFIIVGDIHNKLSSLQAFSSCIVFDATTDT